MHSYTTTGIVIKRSNLGEADRLITLFTPTKGKITFVAKGVRKPTSKRAGSLELFNHLKFSAIAGKGNLDTLTEVQLIDSHFGWKSHLGRITLAYQLAEIIDKLLPDHDPHPQIFDILSQSLSRISFLKTDWKLKFESWILDILVGLGYWPGDKQFTGNIYQFMEEISSRPFHSPKLLAKLSS